ncbi:MAG: NUDIX domain-containing protein [Candidatus Aenigmarchaeota archaeon]|nr:NUDIX domain-containing protein [Candidatus Aenigmarchaeota archaeon]
MAKFISTTNCYVEKDGKYLMLHRSKDKDKFPGVWMGPGGKQEAEESIFQTCVREVKEETGIVIENPDLRIVATNNYPDKNKTFLVFIFTSKYKSGDIKKFPGDGELAWIDKKKITELEKLHPDLKWHIPILLKNKKEVIFTYNEYNNKGEVVKHNIIGE